MPKEKRLDHLRAKYNKGDIDHHEYIEKLEERNKRDSDRLKKVLKQMKVITDDAVIEAQKKTNKNLIRALKLLVLWFKEKNYIHVYTNGREGFNILAVAEKRLKENK